jgi:hypothetical protein
MSEILNGFHRDPDYNGDYIGAHYISLRDIDERSPSQDRRSPSRDKRSSSRSPNREKRSSSRSPNREKRSPGKHSPNRRRSLSSRKRPDQEKHIDRKKMCAFFNTSHGFRCKNGTNCTFAHDKNRISKKFIQNHMFFKKDKLTFPNANRSYEVDDRI